MKKNQSVFVKEYEIMENAQLFLKELESGDERVREHFEVLVQNYRQLLRQMESLTRISDRQQNKLNTLLERLGRYVSIQLFKKITTGKEKTDARTERKKLTVFFSDIKDFSYVSSHMEGEALSEFLNSYLEAMTRIVLKWGGTLDKYIGDAIMVFFGDPEFTSHEDHALRCVHMALEMREKMKDLRKTWYDLGFQEPLHCRMGISTGYCTVGNFGSSERMDYTIIGTPVNLAARLESAAEVDEILISHETWGYVKDRVLCEKPQHLHLKGFHHEITAHKLIRMCEEKNGNVFVINEQNRGISVNIDFSKVPKADIQALVNQLNSHLNAGECACAEQV